MAAITVIRHSQSNFASVACAGLWQLPQDPKARGSNYELQAYVRDPCAWGCDNVAPDGVDRPKPIISCWRI